MLRIIGNIEIYGTMASLEKLISINPIPNSILRQIGNKRKVPDIDFWCYGSPLYRFREIISLDEDIRNFLLVHEQLGDFLVVQDSEIKDAIFTLSPVDQSYEETFACLLSNKTLQILVSMGLSLQIAPVSVIPDVGYWR
jgi:hypothetical protein